MPIPFLEIRLEKDLWARHQAGLPLDFDEHIIVMSCGDWDWLPHEELQASLASKKQRMLIFRQQEPTPISFVVVDAAFDRIHKVSLGNPIIQAMGALFVQQSIINTAKEAYRKCIVKFQAEPTRQEHSMHTLSVMIDS